MLAQVSLKFMSDTISFYLLIIRQICNNKNCIFVRQIMNKGMYYPTHVDPHYLLYSGKDDRQYKSLFIFQYTHHVNISMLSQCVVCLVTWLFCLLFPCCQFQNVDFFVDIKIEILFIRGFFNNDFNIPFYYWLNF